MGVNMERTLVLVKPDGVERGLVGEVIRRFEAKGLKLMDLKMVKMSPELSDHHYAEHVGKDFYPSLKAFITRGPVVAMVLEGPTAVAVVRKMVGVTDAAQAESGTIRGDLACSKEENLIHASDSVASAEREIGVFFG